MDGWIGGWMDGCVKNEVTIHVYNSNGVHVHNALHNAVH